MNFNFWSTVPTTTVLAAYFSFLFIEQEDSHPHLAYQVHMYCILIENSAMNQFCSA